MTAMQELLKEVILEREKSISVEFREALDFVITAIETDYKEMENQQIIDAWNNSRKNKSDCSNWNCSGDEKTYDNFKQYYNETFNK